MNYQIQNLSSKLNEVVRDGRAGRLQYPATLCHPPSHTLITCLARHRADAVLEYCHWSTPISHESQIKKERGGLMKIVAERTKNQRTPRTIGPSIEKCRVPLVTQLLPGKYLYWKAETTAFPSTESPRQVLHIYLVRQWRTIYVRSPGRRRSPRVGSLKGMSLRPVLFVR